MARPSRYSADFRARAMRLVAEPMPEHDTEWAAITSVAHNLGVSSETLRKWIRQAQVDDGQRPGTTSDESAELIRWPTPLPCAAWKPLPRPVFSPWVAAARSHSLGRSLGPCRGADSPL
jgi:transposase-like protein